MLFHTTVEIIGAFIAFSTVAGILWVRLKSKIYEQNENIKTELIANQERKIKELQDQIDEQRTVSENLSRDVDYWKKEPIRALADNYSKLVKLHDENYLKLIKSQQQVTNSVKTISEILGTLAPIIVSIQKNVNEEVGK